MPYYAPKHWHMCAEEARTMADGIVDPAAKKTMVAIAAAYDEMAKNAEHDAVTQPAAKNP